MRDRNREYAMIVGDKIVPQRGDRFAAPDSQEMQELRAKLADNGDARDRAWNVRLLLSGETYYSYNDRASFDPREPMEYLDEKTYKKLPENIRGQLLVQARYHKGQYGSLNRGTGAVGRSVSAYMADIQELDARIELAAKYTGLGMPSEVQVLLRENIKQTITKITKQIEDAAAYTKAGDEARAGERLYRRWWLESLLDTYSPKTDADVIEAATKALADMDADADTGTDEA